MANAKTPLFIKDMSMNTFISVIILAVITLGIAIYNFVTMSGEMQTISEMNAELDLLIGEYGDEVMELLPDDAMEYVKIARFYAVFVPVYNVVSVLAIIASVLVVIKFRPAYAVISGVYGLQIILEIVLAVFALTVGFFDNLPSSVVFVIVRFSFIKYFMGIFLSTREYSVPGSYTPADNLRPEVKGNYGVPTPVGSTMQSVGGNNTMPSASAVPVPEPSSMSAVGGGVDLSKPVDNEKWQCRGCGVENFAKDRVCPFCGSERK